MNARETALNDAARRVMIVSNYDPHYAALEDKCLMETRLFLARLDALCTFYGVKTEDLLHRMAAPAVIVTDSRQIGNTRETTKRETVRIEDK